MFTKACNQNIYCLDIKLFCKSLIFITKCSHNYISVQISLVTQSCPTLSDPMDCSMPGFPVSHQHPELTQTHDHRVGDGI